MNEKINKELNVLQNELMKLGSAVSHIHKAEKISNETIAAIQEVQKKYENALGNIQKYTEDIFKISKDNIDSSKADIGGLTEDVKKEIKSLSDTLGSQVKETNKLLANYLDLAKSTAELSSAISEINFPARLDRITANMGEINTEIRSIQNTMHNISENKILTINKKIAKNTRRTNFIMLLAIIGFLILLFVGYDVVIKYFPQLNFLK